MENIVTRPEHYRKNKIDTIEIIKNSMPEEAFKGFLNGNIIKYVCRYRYKNKVEDLRKAKWYLERLIKEESKNADNKHLSPTK